MTTQEFIIADGSIMFNTPVNHINRLVHSETGWTKSIDKAKRYTTAEQAISASKEIDDGLPLKVFVLQTDERGVGIGEVKF